MPGRCGPDKSSPFRYFLHRGQQQTDQDGDDGDNHQQRYQAERASAAVVNLHFGP
jgi:hypothetical protein